MELDFTIQLLCQNRQKKQGLPNALAVWVDPFWTGIWLFEEGENG